MVRCLHSTVDDAARNKMMIIMHPKPSHLSFILDRECMVHESACKGALIDGRTEMPCIGRVYIHTVHSVHEETSPAFNHDFLNCRVVSFLLTLENVTQDTSNFLALMNGPLIPQKKMGHWDFSRNYKFSYMGPKPTNILTWSSTFEKSRHMLGRFNNGEQ
jgi:hypothetical protein